MSETRLSAEEDGIHLGLGWAIAEQKDVRAPTGVALKVHVLEVGLGVQTNFLVLRLDQVKHEVTAVIAEALSIAKPLVAVLLKTLGDRVGVMNSAVSAMVVRQRLKIVWFHMPVFSRAALASIAACST